MTKKNIIVIGASSGIGFELTKNLIEKEENIWAIARNTESLESLEIKNLKITNVDISIQQEVLNFSLELKAAQFFPDVIIINAGIYHNDMLDNIETTICENILKTNFLGAIYCVNALLPLVPQTAQFITVSSSSAYKGSAFEGAGYAASKAAISIAFESFYMKWSKNGPLFTTIFFGPLDTSLRRNKGKSIFLTSTEKAVQKINKAIDQRKPVYYQPEILFFFLRLAKILPPRLYLFLLGRLESRMNR